MEIWILASGSSGNSMLVSDGRTRVLMDAGLSLRELERRLGQIGESAHRLDAVCISHEHSDHCRGLRTLYRRHGLPVYVNEATAAALEQFSGLYEVRWHVFQTGEFFDIGSLRFQSFAVSHDASDPVGFVVSNAHSSVGIVTDLGVATESVRTWLGGCDAVVLESNHDEDMLRSSRRPWSLKQRIAGRQGHLSNAAAAELLATLAGGRLRVAYLAHLSAECNHPPSALRAVTMQLREYGLSGLEVRLTYPDRVSEPLRL